MAKLRDKISEITGFYFTEKVKLSVSFTELQKAGRFDSKTIIGILGVVCDFLEKRELEKKS